MLQPPPPPPWHPHPPLSPPFSFFSFHSPCGDTVFRKMKLDIQWKKMKQQHCSCSCCYLSACQEIGISGQRVLKSITEQKVKWLQNTRVGWHEKHDMTRNGEEEKETKMNNNKKSEKQPHTSNPNKNSQILMDRVLVLIGCFKKHPKNNNPRNIWFQLTKKRRKKERNFFVINKKPCQWKAYGNNKLKQNKLCIKQAVIFTQSI